MIEGFRFYVGDWATVNHRVCLMDAQGEVVNERWTEHSGAGLNDLAAWLSGQCRSAPVESIGIAIEVPSTQCDPRSKEHYTQLRAQRALPWQ